jgi:hypothetical protein
LFCIVASRSHQCKHNALVQHRLTAQSQARAQVIYFGGLSPGWNLAARGATSIVYTDAERACSDGPSSLSATVEPWGSLTLEAAEPFRSYTVLDAWIKESAVYNAELRLESTKDNRISDVLPLWGANQDPAISRLMGPDDDGWYRLQVNLDALIGIYPNSGRKGGASSTWNRISFTDASGEGMTLLLCNTAIYPASQQEDASPAPEGDVQASCVGAACNPALADAPIEPELVPLYGGDVVADSLGPPRPVIARLKPGATRVDALLICAKLEGAVVDEQIAAFRGRCLRDFADVDGTVDGDGDDAATAVAVSEENDGAWPFFTFTVESEDDLMAMRADLVDVIEFFERDGIMYANPSGRTVGSGGIKPKTKGLGPAPMAEAEETQGLVPNPEAEGVDPLEENFTSQAALPWG